MTDKFDFLGCRRKHIKLCVNTGSTLSAEITERKQDFRFVEKKKFHPPSNTPEAWEER